MTGTIVTRQLINDSIDTILSDRMEIGHGATAGEHPTGSRTHGGTTGISVELIDLGALAVFVAVPQTSDLIVRSLDRRIMLSQSRRAGRASQFLQCLLVFFLEVIFAALGFIQNGLCATTQRSSNVHPSAMGCGGDTTRFRWLFRVACYQGLEFARLHGIDDRQVVPDREAKSISAETTFAEDISDTEVLREWLVGLVEQVARRLRRHEIRGRTIELKVRFADFKTITRMLTLAEPTNITQSVFVN